MNLRVATFNIRNSSAPDGDNAWPVRRETTALAIEALDADVVGLQEVLPDQLAYLRERFAEYEIVGAGRDDGSRMRRALGRDGAAGAMADHQARDPLALPEPSTPGSVGWDADLTRIATLVHLEHTDGTEVGVANTHYDHSRRARSGGVVPVARRLDNRRGAVGRDG